MPLLPPLPSLRWRCFGHVLFVLHDNTLKCIWILIAQCMHEWRQCEMERWKTARVHWIRLLLRNIYLQNVQYFVFALHRVVTAGTHTQFNKYKRWFASIAINFKMHDTHTGDWRLMFIYTQIQHSAGKSITISIYDIIITSSSEIARAWNKHTHTHDHTQMSRECISRLKLRNEPHLVVCASISMVGSTIVHLSLCRLWYSLLYLNQYPCTSVLVCLSSGWL